MRVTHHRTEKEFKTYLVNAPWEDLEQDCHLGRTIRVFFMFVSSIEVLQNKLQRLQQMGHERV